MSTVPQPRKPRSVIVTTLLVMFTIFVIVPILLMVGCQALVIVGGVAGR
jgi:uncharacterized membrane protein